MEYLTTESLGICWLWVDIYNSKGDITSHGGISNADVKQTFTMKWDHYVFDLITDGTSKININRKDYTYKYGDINIRMPGDITYQNPHIDYQTIGVHIKLQNFENKEDFKTVLDDLPHKITPVNFETFTRLAEDMIMYKNLEQDYSEWKLHSLAYEFLSEILKTQVQPRVVTSGGYNPKITKALKYIHKNRYFEKLTVKDLSEYAGLEEKYFSKTFKSITGKTPIQYITDMHMKEAMHYIKTTQKTISEISDLFGYSNCSYFAKKFKEYYGKTPVEFRSKK